MKYTVFVSLASPIVEERQFMFLSAGFDQLRNYDHTIQVIDEKSEKKYTIVAFISGMEVCVIRDPLPFTITSQTITKQFSGIFCTHFLARQQAFVYMLSGNSCLNTLSFYLFLSFSKIDTVSLFQCPIQFSPPCFCSVNIC